MGPLQGIRVVEFAGIGPGPFCAMMLSDMGAEVIRVERKGLPLPGETPDPFNPGRLGVTNRGRRSLALDLKATEGAKTALRLIEKADALLEGFRPGVMEKLGLGPEPCMSGNPRLVYGRMTGWGQHGPLSHAAGHDINYISLSGALHAIGVAGQKPVVPLNLVGDFGGGAMMLAFGVVCGIVEAQRSGRGQVVDAAMTDGAAALMAMMYGLKAQGLWSNERGTNLLDGGAHFYDTYECADGRFIALGALEPQFYQLLLENAEISDPRFRRQLDSSAWPALKEKLATLFRTRPRDEWCGLLEGTDACVAPVLDLDEAPQHPHNRARGAFLEIEGVVQPAPAPRFSRTPPEVQRPPALPGEHTDGVLADWGFSQEEIARLRREEVI